MEKERESLERAQKNQENKREKGDKTRGKLAAKKEILNMRVYDQLQKEQQLVDGLSRRESQLGKTQSRAEKRENAVKKRDFPLLMDVFLWKQVQQSSYKIYDVHINC